MGSVQSEWECSKCKYPSAFQDYYYRSGEIYRFCGRCGYHFSAFVKHDLKRGQEIKRQVESLIAENKITEALKLANYESARKITYIDDKPVEIPISEWPIEEQINSLRNIKAKSYYKMDPDGKPEWDIQKSGGYGAYMHRVSSGFGRSGSFKNKWDAKKAIKDMIKHMKKTKKKESISYTKKICGVWYKFDAKTGIKEEMEVQHERIYEEM